VTDQRQAAEAVERTVAALGRLDTLVNSAGVKLLGPLVAAPLQEWQRMVEVNLLGLLYCSHTALPHLLRAVEDRPRRVADLVNISVAGREVRQGSGVYNATKHGVGAFSEALRQEVTGRHVRVSLIEPGAIATELSSHNRPEIREQINQRFAGIERLQPRTSPMRSLCGNPCAACCRKRAADPPDPADLIAANPPPTTASAPPVTVTDFRVAVPRQNLTGNLLFRR
jgi:NADP-dependent 3-hydroxy acid dehydrogenase YdfG